MMNRTDQGSCAQGALTDMASSLIQVLELVYAVNDPMGDTGLHCVESLLNMAKDIVDDACDEGSVLNRMEGGNHV